MNLLSTINQSITIKNSYSTFRNWIWTCCYLRIAYYNIHTENSVIMIMVMAGHSIRPDPSSPSIQLKLSTREMDVSLWNLFLLLFFWRKCGATWPFIIMGKRKWCCCLPSWVICLLWEFEGKLFSLLFL